MPRNLLKEIGQGQAGGADIPQSALGRRLLIEPETPVLPPIEPQKQQVIPLSRRAAEPSAIGDNIADAAVYAGKQVVGAGEAAMSLASGMMLYVPSKIAGTIGAALGQDPRMVEEWFQTEFLPAYQPYTKAGQQAVAPIQKLFEWGLMPAHKVGEIVEKHIGSRDAGYAAEMAAEFATFAAVGGAKRIVTPKAKPFKTAKGQAETLRKERLQARVKDLDKPLGKLTEIEKLTKVEKGKVAGAIGRKIEGKPISPEERLIIRPKPDFIEKAKIRVGGKPGIRETIHPEVPRPLGKILMPKVERRIKPEVPEKIIEGKPRNLVKEIKETPPTATTDKAIPKRAVADKAELTEKKGEGVAVGKPTPPKQAKGKELVPLTKKEVPLKDMPTAVLLRAIRKKRESGIENVADLPETKILLEVIPLDKIDSMTKPKELKISPGVSYIPPGPKPTPPPTKPKLKNSVRFAAELREPYGISAGDALRYADQARQGKITPDELRVKLAKKVEPRVAGEVWKQDTSLEPRAYQEKYPEKTVHLDWDKANSPRFVFEGAGDILRELQKEYKDTGYISEKIKRVERFFKERHPDDTLGAAKKHEPEKLKRLISQYENQPTNTATQASAKRLILNILKGEFLKAQNEIKTIRGFLEYAAKPALKSVKAKPEPKKASGRAYILKLNKNVPFTEFKEFTKGKNKGRIEVKYQGRKFVIEKDSVKVWPDGAEEFGLDFMGIGTIYEKTSSWVKAVKSGNVEKVREFMAKARKQFLQPVEGNPLDKSAIEFLKSEKLSDYFKSMPDIGDLTIANVQKYMKPGDIALIKRGGKLRAALRKSGFYAIPEFSTAVSKYKDIGKLEAAWSDPSRMIEAIDQGHWGRMVQKHVLWPARMTTLAKIKWCDVKKSKLAAINEKYNIHSGRKNKSIGDIIEYISGKDAWGWKPEKILKIPDVEKILSKHKEPNRIKIVKAGMEHRKFFQNLLDNQNHARKITKRELIPYRMFYRPWIMERNLWAKLSGLRVRPKEIMDKPEMPDFIALNNPFNARALAREGLLAKYPKERNITRLMTDYIETASKDIFDTNIVHNNKIHSAVLKHHKLLNAAEGIDRWTSEVFAGTKPQLSRWVASHIPLGIRLPVKVIATNLRRAVFPLNWSWNVFIQTCSSGITYARYGHKACLSGLDYFTNPAMRKAIRENAYSIIIKRRWGGQAYYQDLQHSILKYRKLEATKLDKVEYFANYLTSSIEDALTGHAISAAYYHGEKVLGLKGRSLWEYASEGGAKTQSMYDFGGTPGFLRAKEVGQVQPFQTYAFEIFNTIREMNLSVVRSLVGRTGIYQTMSANSVKGKALISKRLGMIARLTVAIMVTNAVVEKAIGRKPWQPSSFIPFLGLIIGGYSGRSPILHHEYRKGFEKGIKNIIVYEDFGAFKKWLIRWNLLGGLQIERTWEGLEAVAKGRVTDVRGRTVFKVKGTEEKIRAISLGPYRTKAGMKKLSKFKKGRGMIGAILKSREKKKGSSKLKGLSGGLKGGLKGLQ